MAGAYHQLRQPISIFYRSNTIELREGLVLLPQFGSPSGPTHRPFNAYALVFGDRCVLFDAPLATPRD